MATFEDPMGVPGAEAAADTATRASSAVSPSEDPLKQSGDASSDEGESPEQRQAASRADGDQQADGDTPPESDGETELERDLEELSARAAKADEYLELAQRTKADFENYRKRAAREAALAQDRGIAKVAKELLPAIDNLDRAVQAAAAFAHGSPEESAAEVESQLASGIKLVHADVLSALARLGIEPFSPAGERFDPQLHEAVAQQPIEGHEAGIVVEVYQQGYRLGETVLRPARVLVAG